MCHVTTEIPICQRCGIIHIGPPYDHEEAISNAAHNLADAVDDMVADHILREMRLK